MSPEFIGPILAGFAALVGLGFGVYESARRYWQQQVTDLQGNKEAVAATAARVRRRKIPKFSRSRRQDIFEGLCLAAIFERSGRTRSQIYAALNSASRTPRYCLEVRTAVQEITVAVARNQPYTDLSKALKRLDTLKAALSIDQDVRIILTRRELATLSTTNPRRKTLTPDVRLTHQALKWTSLRKVIEEFGSVIAVSPVSTDKKDSCLVLALDFHLSARSQPDGRDEKFELTDWGRRVRYGKYDSSELTIEELSRSTETQRCAALLEVADALSRLITRHSNYNDCTAIAVTPGRNHDYSDRLGDHIWHATGKRLIKLRRGCTESGDLKFEPITSINEYEKIILVDDVYRSGNTIRAASKALWAAGAGEVLGLTATCTVSPSTPCHP